MESEINNIFENLYGHEKEIILNKAQFLLENGYMTGDLYNVARLMAEKLHEKETENVYS